MKTSKHSRFDTMQRSMVKTGVTALFMLIVCLSPLLSLNTPTASAQQVCPPGKIWSESQQKCVPLIDTSNGPIVVDPRTSTPTPDIPIIPDWQITPEPEPTVVVIDDVDETPTVEIDIDGPILIPTETVEPAAEGSVSIVIFPTSCPAGYDNQATGFNFLYTDCYVSVPGAAYGASNGNGWLAQGSVGADPYVQFNGLPSGPMAIVETSVPPGISDPAVYCSVSPEGGAEGPKIKQTLADPNQTFDLYQGGDTVYCHWFYASTGPTPTADGDSTIIINKHGCPMGYDPSAADIYDLAANCQESQNGVTFIVSDGASSIAGQVTGDVLPNMVQFENMPAGPLSIVEQVPSGYGVPLVFCDEFPFGDSPTNISQEQVLDGNQIFHLFDQPGMILYCDWFNVPVSTAETASLIVHKYDCPSDYAASADLYDLTLHCQGPLNGVGFLVSDGQTVLSQTTGDVVDSGIQIDNVPVGPFSILEQVPVGYQAPYVFCGAYSEADPNPAISQELVLDGNQIFHIFEAGETFICDWFNVPMTSTTDTPGDVTIYKFTCPAGYNVMMLGADPAADCAAATNGVTFTLDGPNGYHSQSNTGDSINGAVSFGGLAPGTYQANELLPAGIVDAFVWDCTGGSIGMVQNHPISSGTSLEIPVASGDQIACNWYNVPAYDPQVGQIHLLKYACIGSVYTSPVNCEIYEGGAEFNLLTWNGSQWVGLPNYSGQTNAYGELNWNGLGPGSYQIDEINGDPCYITSDHQDGQGNISLLDGQVTTVKVYNCGFSTSTPAKPGKPTTKYPNTGIAPAVSKPTPAAQDAAENDAPLAGFEAAEGVCPVAAATPEPQATPEPFCDRGPVPVSIKIEAIGVDAKVEVLETVNGVMQAPSDEKIVSWYKETSRLGENGNLVLAGHLNYWGIPQAVFFAIDTLEAGDIITVTGDNGEVYEYEVQWVRQLDAFASPNEAVAPTDEESLTLITCGGEWNAAAGEYDHRTVVRAVRLNAA